MVVVDTNIIIGILRGNEIALNLLKKYKAHAGISIITEIELAIGATDKLKKAALESVIKTHTVLPLNKKIGEKALQLIQLHNTPQHRLFLGDALIAATCIENGASLLTFNTRDFKFIKGLKLAK